MTYQSINQLIYMLNRLCVHVFTFKDLFIQNCTASYSFNVCYINFTYFLRTKLWPSGSVYTDLTVLLGRVCECDDTSTHVHTKASE